MSAPVAPSMAAPSRAVRTERWDVVVVGGGQAGLAVGHELAARGLDFVILDAERRTGDTWRHRWDSLRLFTPAKHDGLPGMVFPAPPSHLPDKDEVADFLERYAERFDLPIRRDTRVESLRHDGERYVLRAGGAVHEADAVVVATGAFQRPRVPALAGRIAPDVVQLHSSAYRNPFVLPDGPVLVVGAANSGAQIALELARHRPVWLSGRDTGTLPRRVLGRDLFDWVWPPACALTVDTPLGRRLRARVRLGGDARIGITERVLVDAGITRVGRLDAVRDGRPVCAGVALDPRTIVWCTGFDPDWRWIDLPVLAADGAPRQHRGAAVEHPGLFFVGLRFQHRLTSSLLGGVGADAVQVGAAVARHCEALAPA